MDDLAASIIHDVKNQLAELTLHLERRGDAMKETALALKASQRLTGLLLMYRQQSGQLSAHVDTACPSDLLNELAAEYSELFPDILIDVDVGTAPSYGFYDQTLIRLALSNALHNACSFARSSVALSVRSEGGFLVFEVKDNGPGFPQEMLASLFEAPSRLGRHGTGLGLYLAGKIAALHRMEGRSGEISLTNADGACFQLKLP